MKFLPECFSTEYELAIDTSNSFNTINTKYISTLDSAVYLQFVDLSINVK